jgi:Gas vesicle synthesis protein GvpO
MNPALPGAKPGIEEGSAMATRHTEASQRLGSRAAGQELSSDDGEAPEDGGVEDGDISGSPGEEPRAARRDAEARDDGPEDEPDDSTRRPRRRTAQRRPARGGDAPARRRRTAAGEGTAEARPRARRDADSDADDADSDADSTHGQETAQGRRISAAAAARAGLRGLAELISKRPEGVTAVEPTDDGWVIGIEVLEDRRVPSSADILAIYEAQLDAEGTLLSYRRTRRYLRGRGDGGDS